MAYDGEEEEEEVTGEQEEEENNPTVQLQFPAFVDFILQTLRNDTEAFWTQDENLTINRMEFSAFMEDCGQDLQPLVDLMFLSLANSTNKAISNHLRFGWDRCDPPNPFHRKKDKKTFDQVIINIVESILFLVLPDKFQNSYYLQSILYTVRTCGVS
jgi:hypothetical protein